MQASHSSLRVLLVQARNGQDMEIQEQSCFLERCRLERHQLDSLNLAKMGEIPQLEEVLKGYDTLFIGGAGEYSAVNDYPWMPFVLELVQQAHDAFLPTFGSCWGHQLIARALGGKVEHDPEKAELGCHHIHLTEEGKSDRLFKDFPSKFMANMGHHDRVTRLPDTGIDLAQSRTQPFEAFCIRNRPIYGTQFHSELDAHRERERLIRYRSYYVEQMPSEDVFQAVLHGLRETTEVDHLMFDFLTKFAVSGSN